MKKTLLTLALACGVTAFANAQGCITQTRNAGLVTGLTSSAFPAQARPVNISVPASGVIWATGYSVLGTGAVQNTWFRSTDSGATWTFGTFSISTNLRFGMFTATNATTAYLLAYNSTAAGGEIRRTTDGGATWPVVYTFTGATSFPNVIHFFNANEGIVAGDPVGGSFEILRTTNGGTSWTRVSTTNIPLLGPQDYGLVGAYYGNSQEIWMGTYNVDQTGARVIRSLDKGLTYTVAATPFAQQVSHLAVTGTPGSTTGRTAIISADLDIVRSTNPTAASPAYNTFLNVAGNYYAAGPNGNIDAVPGTSNSFISAGYSDLIPTGGSANYQNWGASYSTNGGTSWTDIMRGVFSFDVAFLSPTEGYFTGTNQAAFTSTGGCPYVAETPFYKWTGSASVLGIKKDVETQASLKVYPNPSGNGKFTLNLKTGFKAGTELRVNDLLGRTVYERTLLGEGLETTVDLSTQKAGIYVLELRTANGLATQKLVIE